MRAYTADFYNYEKMSSGDPSRDGSPRVFSELSPVHCAKEGDASNSKRT